ncbi:MAG: VIT domain-containing protein [Bacteroidota bacterium]
MRLTLSFFIIYSLMISANAQTSVHEDKTESPYFQIIGDSKQLQLPLISTSVEAKIAGVIADVEVRQTYENTGTQPIEAVYVFPGSTRSAIFGMNMKIADRLIIAEVKEKKQALETFEKAKSEGKSASLLQQHRPNVFQMNVANIPPGEKVEVTLQYNELLVPDEGIYEFIYPTTVGPRYVDEDGIVKNEWVINPFAIGDENVPQPAFDISVDISAALPLHQVKSTSHSVDIDYVNFKEARVTLQSTSPQPGTEDYILNYSLFEDQIQTGVTLYEGEKENFFLFMMQPPKKAPEELVVPREYIFIVDVSGSMNGFPLDISKKLMRNLLNGLNAGDRFNVLLFAASSEVMSHESVEVTPESIEKGIAFIDSQNAGGGTEMLPELERALAMPKLDGYSKNIIIVTDGFVAVEREAFDLIRNNLGEANFFPFGIGGNVNRYLIEGMARVGHGSPLVITRSEEAKDQAEKFRQYISSPLLTDIDVKFKGLDVYDVEPKHYPDLFAEKPLLIYGKWRGKPKGKIEVDGLTGKTTFTSESKIDKASLSSNAKALKYLWARNKVMLLSDYNNLDRLHKNQEAITKLGLKYNLLTQYTSFVGVDEKGPIQKINQSPVSSGAVPEPHEWAMITLALLLVGFLALRKYV